MNFMEEKKAMFTSQKTDWETPQLLFDRLNAVHNFTLDVCADSWNYKCAKYFDRAVDGLAQSWQGETCWMNPPYGGKSVKVWMKKAYDEFTNNGASVVCLVPARTDTVWWHTYATKATHIEFIKGRLKFSQHKDSAPFPSVVLTYTR